MERRWLLAFLFAVCCFLAIPRVNAQVTSADYERATNVRSKYKGLALDVADSPFWIKGTHKFVYRKTVEGGSAFVLVDADAGTKAAAFDHEKLASVLSETAGEKFTAVTLPFQRFRLNKTGTRIEFVLKESRWSCDIAKYSCSEAGPIQDEWSPFEPDGEDAEAFKRHEKQIAPSPDGKWLAYVENFNLFIRPKTGGDGFPLSLDGAEGNSYDFDSIAWSPDSQRVVAYRVRAGYHRKIQFIESSPKNQLQPKYSVIEYEKPGDVLDHPQPVLFEVASKKQANIDNSLFANPYELTHATWWKDGRAFTFEYNQRGHQVYRIIEVDAATGTTRSLISEESKTFIDYPRLVKNQHDTGKTYRYDVRDGSEIIWMSERDGWAHLYLYDGKTGALKNQITKGNWVVRAVDRVDEEKRQIWFEASGMYPGRDPYFMHAYRINFDGSGLTPLTSADANHDVNYSSDGQYYIDIFSRVDEPTKAELRRSADASLAMKVEQANIQKLDAAGWKPPEVFTAMGRDGKTDIWGLIYRPANFDPKKKYPVIESIYAGPQGSFVQKSFFPSAESLTELGFVVVHIDGMGTNNRSKAFHDVAWKNLKDGGFADRILWHKAVAAKYPWYDISRVGVFGTSAGGQNALGALLFHPEFYKAGVANSGSHDNRMDKIWWNELWMSWPIGPHYAESSNVDNAYRLKGNLLLIVGEMDNNVDPASTWQVVNALIRANKMFDLLFVPGGGHGAGGEYGQRLMGDFFVRNLLHEWPPEWNSMQAPSTPSPASGR
jgi:dipeptidyl aminopeptidase/acylaminoacyl peptidase